jgi:DNA primase
MEAQNYTFMEAVRELANRVGLPLPQEMTSSEGAAPQEDLSLLKTALQEASTWFQKNLFHAKGTSALQYTERRRLARDTLKKFGLGYAPEGRHSLEIYLKDKGFSIDTLVKVGFRSRDTGSAPYDKFRQRLMFPIHDVRGNIVGFGGRLLEAGEPKYLNSPETPLFSKGKLLYGYVHAKEKPASDPLLIVEGYMDVISLQQAGFKGAVAPLGTALTEDQFLLAWRLAPEPILCFDGIVVLQLQPGPQSVLPLLKPGYSL